ncbi:hypothetical protein [Acidocella sp.]|uniref:hypothetical protein n=1 Tax=Acidocella sp. TaxID=50710 RepID=UPI00263474B9|nr:hypothetical protein [Acidocella sp.]
MSFRDSQTPYFRSRFGPGPGPRPNRAPRREVCTGSLLAQQCRLIFGPNYGSFAAYDCLVTDIANGGYGICLIGRARLGPDHLVGMDAFLEQPDKTLIPVELRWMRGPKIGLKRLPRGSCG